MNLTILERRRSQRVSVESRSWLTVPATWPIRLADVSLGGMAFYSPYAVESGWTAVVRATLGKDAFNTQFRVCWSRPVESTNSVRHEFEIGAAFLSLDDDGRRALKTFLKLSPTD
jgi:PilZ domain